MAGEWDRQVAQVAAALDTFGATGDVLEMAGGTGWWTARLARTAGHLTVIDSSPEALDLNRDHVGRPDVCLLYTSTEHHRGTTVAELSADDVRETASLRTALERLAVDWLCRNATEGDFTRIAVVLQQVGELPGPLSPSRVAALDVAFHDAVFRAAHHERLYRSWRSLRSQIYIDLVYRRALRDDVGQWVICLLYTSRCV